ncbi:MAG TPA: ABC transporter ATP-binding protein [Gammaproteobacteria bacterium]|nr:ABC transporter ATP-binding protein [Gammaproteobacteria bacterium]
MSEPCVQTRNLGKSFSGKAVLEGLNLEVYPGDVVGLIGLNGAGKTTLLEVLAGFSPATQGDVTVFGHPILRLPEAEKRRIGYVPQTDELIPSLKAVDYLEVIASFYPCWNRERINALAGAWQLDLSARTRALSVGQRQKLSLLGALGHQPDLLLLDEPVASLDPLARRQFLQELVEVTAAGERAVILSSHIVSDIERLANRIWVLKDRRLYWSGECDSLKDSVVRIHYRSRERLTALMDLPNVLHRHEEDGYTAMVVQDWSDSLYRQFRGVAGVALEIETLSLEEIFLELHR